MTGDVAFGSSAGLVVGVGPCSYATAVGARQDADGGRHSIAEVVRGSSAQDRQTSHAEAGCQTDVPKQRSVGLRTDALKRAEMAVQVAPSDFARSAEQAHAQLVESLPGYLSSNPPALRRLMACLAENETSRAFDADAAFASGVSSAACLATLRVADGRSAGLVASALAWNCTGNVVALALRDPAASEGWAGHGLLAVWNLALQSQEPEVMLETDAGLTCAAFHPERKMVLAAGTVTGHIVLWDLSQTDPSKRVIAATTLQSEAHTEAVTGVFWRQSVVEQMRLGRANAHQLVSTSTDGQVLVWHPDSFAAPADRVSLAAGGAEVGIAAAAGNAADGGATGHVLLGSETGKVMLVDLPDRDVGGLAHSDGARAAPRGPKTSFSPHAGAVSAARWAPFSPRVFLTAAVDGDVRVCCTHRPAPVVAFSPHKDGLTAAEWSPVRPGVVAVGTAGGAAMLFDLTRGVRAPLLTIPPEAWGASVSGPLRALAFNPTHREQVATARGDQVSVWLLPAALVRKTAGDARVAGALERGEVPAGVLRAGAVA